MLCKNFCDVFESGDHASTFGGNPLVSAVALAVLTALEQENLLSNVIARGEQLRRHLRAIALDFPETFTEVRGWGLINGLQINPESELSSVQVVKAAMEQGLLIAPAGPKVLRFVPPLIVSEQEVEEAVEKLENALKAV
jgi:acetylornithine aminotransferase